MKLDKTRYHELLHTLNIFLEMAETHLLDHHVGKLYKDEIGGICMSISNLYGKVAIDSDEKFRKPPIPKPPVKRPIYPKI